MFQFFEQYKPHKRAFVKDVREAIAYIRDVGRHVITGRLEALKRGQSFGDDILSYLVHVPGKLKLSKAKCCMASGVSILCQSWLYLTSYLVGLSLTQLIFISFMIKFNTNKFIYYFYYLCSATTFLIFFT